MNNRRTYSLFRSQAVEGRQRRLAGELNLVQPFIVSFGTMMLAMVCLAAVIISVSFRWQRSIPLTTTQPPTANAYGHGSRIVAVVQQLPPALAGRFGSLTAVKFNVESRTCGLHTLAQLDSTRLLRRNVEQLVLTAEAPPSQAISCPDMKLNAELGTTSMAIILSRTFLSHTDG